MNLDHIRTFLEIAACGNFNRAAETLNVTQSTVSGRIKAIEDRFGASLFHRSHAGAELTPEGRQFQRYALNLQRMWQQAHQAVTLPPGYRDIFSLAGQVSLWDRLILPWIPWMREKAPDIALRVEADYSTSQMRQLSDGLIDIGVMYTPRQVPGLIAEKLLEEKLVLVATNLRKVSSGWVEDYVYVDWGHNMRRLHAEHFPEMGTPAVSVGLGPLGLEYILANGGSGYFPMRVVRPLVAEGRLHLVEDAPTENRPAYVVYPANPKDEGILALALDGLRHAARLQAED